MSRLAMPFASSSRSMIRPRVAAEIPFSDVLTDVVPREESTGDEIACRNATERLRESLVNRDNAAVAHATHANTTHDDDYLIYSMAVAVLLHDLTLSLYICVFSFLFFARQISYE